MKRISKLVVVAMLFAANGLSVFQIADAAEDTLEDLTTRVQIVSVQQSFLSKPAVPDDDDDGDVPAIANQFLLPASILVGFSPHIILSSTLHNQLMPVASTEIALRDLSPPKSYTTLHDVLALRQSRFAASRRTLAPPLA